MSDPQGPYDGPGHGMPPAGPGMPPAGLGMPPAGPPGQYPMPSAVPPVGRPSGQGRLIVTLAAGLVAVLVLGFLTVRVFSDRRAEPTTIAAGPTSATTVTPTPTATRSGSAPSAPATGSAPTTGSPTGPPSGPSAPVSGPMMANGFGFTAPQGWTRGETWGTGNEAELVDAQANTISVYLWKSQASAEARCQTELKVLQIWVPGEIGAVEPIPLGGLSAPGGTLTAGPIFYQMHCVKRGDLVYNISLKTKAAQRDSAVAALKSVAATWHWSS